VPRGTPASKPAGRVRAGRPRCERCRTEGASNAASEEAQGCAAYEDGFVNVDVVTAGRRSPAVYSGLLPPQVSLRGAGAQTTKTGYTPTAHHGITGSDQRRLR
jgi:hypothetical protein